MFKCTNKIKNANEISAWRNEQSGMIVGLTNGCFDLLHPGHLSFLEACRCNCDYLIVAVNADSSIKSIKPERRPVLGENFRFRMIAGLQSVDFVTWFEEPNATQVLDKLKPNIYFKADDYNLNTIDKEEKKVLEKINAEIKFLPFIAGVSSTKIIEHISNGHEHPLEI